MYLINICLFWRPLKSTQILGIYNHLKAVRTTHIHDKDEVCFSLRSTVFGSKNTHKLILKGHAHESWQSLSCDSDSEFNKSS